MAIRYVNDGGSNTSPYDTLAKAATTMATAITGSSAGDDFYVGMDHAESQASTMTWAFPGTAALPNRVISINTTTEAYDKADNIQFTTTSGDIDANGHVNFYGISAKADDRLDFRGPDRQVYDDCILECVNGDLLLGDSGECVREWTDTDFTISGGGTGVTIRLIAPVSFSWFGGTFSHSGTQPTALFDTNSGNNKVNIRGVDLSALTTAFFDMSDGVLYNASLTHCLLDSGVALITGTPLIAGNIVMMNGCDDTTGNDLLRTELEGYYGSISLDDTTFRSGGASRSSTPYSMKMVSNANATEFSEPHTSWPLEIDVTSTGSKTFTINCLWDSATNIQDDEIWAEFEYLGAAANTQSTFVNDGMANILATPADQTTNAESWTEALANDNEFQLNVTVTVNRVGPVRAWVHLAKPSTAVYVDPLIVVT